MRSILVVEEAPADRRLIAEGFRAADPTLALHFVKDRVEALRFLRRQGKFAREGVPSMILLGASFLEAGGDPLIAEVKGDAAHRFLPLVVLAGPGRLSKVRALYESGANCVVRFPPDMEEFFRLLRTVVDYWFHLVELP